VSTSTVAVLDRKTLEPKVYKAVVAALEENRPGFLAGLLKSTGTAHSSFYDWRKDAARGQWGGHIGDEKLYAIARYLGVIPSPPAASTSPAAPARPSPPSAPKAPVALPPPPSPDAPFLLSADATNEAIDDALSAAVSTRKEALKAAGASTWATLGRETGVRATSISAWFSAREKPAAERKRWENLTPNRRRALARFFRILPVSD
jgi:hypothetical protein